MSCIAFFTFTLRSRAAGFAGCAGQTYDEKGNPVAVEGQHFRIFARKNLSRVLLRSIEAVSPCS